MENTHIVRRVRRHRRRDDVWELLKIIVHLALVVAPTEIGRLVRAGAEYLWKRATVSNCKAARDRFITERSLTLERQGCPRLVDALAQPRGRTANEGQ